MTVDAICTTKYVDELRAIASRYAFVLESLDVVADVAEWSRKHGLPEENSFRTGKTLRNPVTGGYIIGLVSPITPDMVGSVTGRMMVNGFDVAELEKNPRQFVRHLMLHEIAHALDHKRKCVECDRWAFEQLTTLPSKPSLQANRGAGR